MDLFVTIPLKQNYLDPLSKLGTANHVDILPIVYQLIFRRREEKILSRRLVMSLTQIAGLMRLDGSTST
jgi:hypothetical protein